MTRSLLTTVFSSLLLFSTTAQAEEPPVTLTTTEAAPAPASVAPAQAWQVLPEKSNIEWTANYAGKPIVGSFREFKSEITFDPNNLLGSQVKVTMEIAKISSDDKDAESALPGPEWFDAAKAPLAAFATSTIRSLGEEKYEADGTLFIGDKSLPITLPFTVHFYEDKETVPGARYAQVTAETTIKRTDYGIGKGEWAKTDIVADEVKVAISLKAKSALQPSVTP